MDLSLSWVPLACSSMIIEIFSVYLWMKYNIYPKTISLIYVGVGSS